MKNTHYLKCVEPYFTGVWYSEKTFELRKNDRDFKVGDVVYLQKYNAETKTYSGDEIVCDITYILQGYEGIKDNYCILGIKVEELIKSKL